MPATKYYLALDIGRKRVGLALANSVAKLPKALTTIENDDNFLDELNSIIKENDITTLIVGLPRNLEGNETAQTEYTRKVAEKIRHAAGLPIIYQDETLTSRQALEELNSRQVNYNKGQVDALAATYILEDYFKGQEVKT